MFESRSSKYLYLPSQILSHSWTTSLSRQYTIQIWRPKFTATDRQPPQPPHHTTTSSPGSSRFPHKEAMEHSRITWPISAGLPTILDRIKWKSRPQSPPNSRMKPRKSQNAPFSHPWFVGRVGVQIFHLFCPRLKLSEALWGQLWGEAGKENEGELATTSLEFESPPPPQ